MSAGRAIEAPPPPRSPWQLLYGAAHRLRRRWYAGRALHLPRPVISVGNLHWGGTGKTPLTAALGLHLLASGRRVAILSRGYRSRGAGVRVVSAGEGPLLGPLVAGDEPVLLAGEVPGAAVVVCPDRFRAGTHALERLSSAPEVFLLDDGFSHLRLYRDLDILAFPAADLFAGGRLAPSGRLREPLASAAYADAVVLTGAREERGGDLAASLRGYGFRGPGFASRSRVLEPRPGGEPALEPGDRVLAVAGIARPERFVEAVRELGFEPAEILTFPDHHAFPAASLERIRAAWRRSGARCVLTTGKDHVKLLGRLELPMAAVRVRAEPEPDFWAWLDGRLEEIAASR